MRMSETGRSAYNWDVYKNRRSALQHLKRNSILVDTILETEDGLSCEFVHSQVMSAFGDKLNNYIRSNGTYVTRPAPSSCTTDVAGARTALSPPIMSQVKLVRLPRVNRYTLGILIDCAYTGYIRTDLPSGGIWQVLEMAEHYEMQEMIRACCNFLVKNLDRSNCIQFYHVGAKHRHTLQRCAWHKIRANFKHLLFWSGDNFNPSGLDHQSTVATQHTNPLASIKYEHFEALLHHDKLNVDSEESVWDAIRMWCQSNPTTVNLSSTQTSPSPALLQPDGGGGMLVEEPSTRKARVVSLLPCIRFPRFRSGPNFPQQCMWRDPLVIANRQAQDQLALLESQNLDLLSLSVGSQVFRDGHNLPCASHPRQLRPRVPHSILLAIGGWQQGQPSRLIESYDANCNLWFESSHRISAPLAYHGIEFINGLLYVCGGTDGTEILNEVFTFDPVRGECSQRSSMREARCYVSTAHLGGYLYAMGGHNGSARMRSVERYQVSAPSTPWMPVHDMNVARSDASACVRQQTIYIAGGLNDQLIEASVEFYNLNDDTWTFLTSMATPRTSFALLLYQDTLLAIGGNNGRERLASVEQYSFFTKLWSAHSSMLHRRSTFSAALLDERRLVVVGGYNGQTPFSQVEMWDEGVRQWVSLHKIRFDRSGLKVVAVSDLTNALDYTFLGSAMVSSNLEPQAAAMLAAGAPLAAANTSSSSSRGSNSNSSNNNQAPP